MSGKRRGRLSRAQAQALASKFESSGLTRKQFSDLHGVAVSSLSRYLQRYRTGDGSGSPQWVEVELKPQTAGPGSELTICMPHGERIEVLPGFDPETLHQLLRVLEQH